MRRFFFFKSSSNSNEESNRTPPVPQNGSKTPDLDSKSKRRSYASELEISSPHLRRSLSFSSPATYYDMDDTDFHESPPIFQNSNNFANNCPIHQHMGTPERDDNFSISNSSHNSPVNPNPNCIKNRANKNKYLDVYIEGEQQHQEENQSSSSDNTNKGFGLGKPPRARCTEKFKDFKDSESATSVEDIYEDTTGARAFWSNQLDYNSDEILILKAKEAEERVRVFSEDSFEPEFLRAKGVTAESLFKLIKDLNEERKYLARELCTQTKSRITERLNSDEKFNISKIDLLTKVNKIKFEEKRLRDRVRELAEQNVSLQREVCGLKLKEENNFERIRVYENELNSLKKENLEISENLIEVKEKFNEAEGQLGHFRSCYKEKEEENKDLKKVIFRLNKTCSE